MHVTKTNISDTKIKLEVSAGEAYLEPIKQKVLKKLSGQIKLAGFRAGKAPLSLVEKHADPSQLQSEFIDAALTQLYGSAIEEHKLRPVDRPKVELTKFVPFTDLAFTAEVDVVGDISLPDYTKLKKSRPEAKVTAQDVTDVLQSLQKRNADKKDVDRAAKDGDEVWIDFSGKDAKGEPVKGGDGKDYPLLLGSNTFIPGFEDQLVGQKAGEEKTFTLTFPKDYGVKTLAGQKVTFTAKVTKVQEVSEPELDDAFAGKLGPFKSIDALKADVKEQLQVERQREANQAFENELIREIVKKSKVPTPDSLIAEQVERLNTEFRQNLAYRGLTFEEFLENEGKTEEQFVTTELRPQAEERVKAGLVLGEIADKEQIDVTPEELEIRIQLLKGQYKDAAMQAELDKPENRREIASRMLTEKAISKLVEHSTK